MADAVLVELAEYHNDVIAALKLYFAHAAKVAPQNLRRKEAIDNVLTSRLEETDQRTAFFILARLEAAFRMDYECRCKKKMKDDLSKSFWRIWRNRKTRVHLEDDIFEAWKAHSSVSKRLISELRGAFNFRHWLAHGRYWTPKLGRRYDFILSIPLLTMF
jgi:hypothetical protein